MFQVSALVYFLPALLIGMTFHEAMHAFTAHWLGDYTAKLEGRLTLNPLKHVDLITTILLPMVMILSHLPPILAAKPVPFNPERIRYREYGVALVGLSGPFTNFILAVISSLILRTTNPTQVVYTFLLVFTYVNISLFIFNLIPIPPLDGSRALYSIAPEWLQEFMNKIESIGFITILLIFVILISIFGGVISSWIIGLSQFLLGPTVTL